MKRIKLLSGGGAGGGKKGFIGFLSTFLGLTDTPNTYAGQATKVLQVNAAETAVEFVTGKGVANGFASLDASGKLPTSQLPPLAISDYLGSVASQVAMLALVGERGDWCIRTDTNTVFIAINEPTSIIGNWQQLVYPGTTAHAFAGALHTADTITNVNTKLSDGSLITTKQAEISALTEKTSPVGADLLIIEDSADTNKKKKVQISNILFPRYVFFADQLSFPNNADWPITALAPAEADPLNNGFVVREFDDTTDEGVGFTLDIPSNVTGILLSIKSRAYTAPGVARQVILRLYTRQITDNAAVGAWSAATTLTAIDIPTNQFFQFDSQSLTLAALGLTAGRVVQFEIVRHGTDVSDTLAGDYTLLEIKVNFF